MKQSKGSTFLISLLILHLNSWKWYTFDISGPKWTQNSQNRLEYSWKKFHDSKIEIFGPAHTPTGRNWPEGQITVWKGPNGPKTAPQGIIHNYLSCRPTLGPLWDPLGPQKGLKQLWNRLFFCKFFRNFSRQFLHWIFFCNILFKKTWFFCTVENFSPKNGQNFSKNLQ